MIEVGDLTTNFLKRDPSDSGGLPDFDVTDSPFRATDVVLNDLANRISILENSIEFKVDQGSVITAIRLTEEALLLTADQIAVVGQVTFADYVRDQNGQSTGVIDPAITQIIGDKIRTGSIWSNAWIDTGGTDGMVMDLDNSAFYLGGDTTPTLQFSSDAMTMRGNIAVTDRGSELGFFQTGDADYNGSTFSGDGVLIGTPGVFGVSSSMANGYSFGLIASSGDVIFGDAGSSHVYFDVSAASLEVQGDVQIKDNGANTGFLYTGTADWTGSAFTGNGIAIGTFGIYGVNSTMTDGTSFGFNVSSGDFYAGDLDSSNIYYDVSAGELSLEGDMIIKNNGANYGFLRTGTADYNGSISGTGVIIGSMGIFGASTSMSNGYSFGVDVSTGDVLMGDGNASHLFYDVSAGELELYSDLLIKDNGSNYGFLRTGTANWNGTSFSGNGVLVGTPGIFGTSSSMPNGYSFGVFADSGDAIFGDLTGDHLFYDVSTGILELEGTLQVGSSVDGGVTIGTKTATEINDDTDTALSTANTADGKADTAITNAAIADAKAVAAQNDVDSYTHLTNILENSSAQIQAGSTAFILAGTTTNGVYLGSAGLYGKSGGSTTFAITSTGAASFAGSLSAATGTFAGSLSAATGTFNGTLSSTKQVKCNITSDALSSTAAVYGSYTGSSAIGGVYGFSNSSLGYGVQAQNSSGVALKVLGTSSFSGQTDFNSGVYMNGNHLYMEGGWIFSGGSGWGSVGGSGQEFAYGYINALNTSSISNSGTISTASISNSGATTTSSVSLTGSGIYGNSSETSTIGDLTHEFANCYVKRLRKANATSSYGTLYVEQTISPYAGATYYYSFS